MISPKAAVVVGVGILCIGMGIGLGAGYIASAVDPGHATIGLRGSSPQSGAQATRPRVRTAPVASPGVAAGQEAGARAQPVLPSLAPVVQECMPAVVGVGVMVTPDEVDAVLRLRENMPGGQPGPGRQDAAPGVPRVPQFRALGTGFVVDAGGAVVTNNHVVQGIMSELHKTPYVRLPSGDTYEAEVAGTDLETDLAAIRVKPKDTLPSLEWADSDAVRLGDWVIAIGNPFGLESSVSLGIISGRGRQLVTPARVGAHTYDDFLQTDAAINPGNSGGPLLDLEGRVVGINTAIQTDTPVSERAGSIGIGFAIPAKIAAFVTGQLFQNGDVVRGYIDVQLPSSEVEKDAGSTGQGALLSGVGTSGPAGRAGLRVGDVVVEFAGSEIHSSKDLIGAVAVQAVGAKAPVTYVRDGKRRQTEVQVARRPTVDEIENKLTGSGAH